MVHNIFIIQVFKKSGMWAAIERLGTRLNNSDEGKYKKEITFFSKPKLLHWTTSIVSLTATHCVETVFMQQTAEEGNAEIYSNTFFTIANQQVFMVVNLNTLFILEFNCTSVLFMLSALLFSNGHLFMSYKINILCLFY